MKVKVNHTGSYRTNPTKELPEGVIYTFQKDVPVDLPDEAIKALGRAAVPTDDPIPGERGIKATLNKMVSGSVTK